MKKALMIVTTLVLGGCDTGQYLFGEAPVKTVKLTPVTANMPAVARTPAPGKGPHAKDGFVTEVEDNRLWVFAAGSKIEKSEKRVSLIGAGPNRMTLLAPDRETALNYLAAKPGFVTAVEDGRIWVYKVGDRMEKGEKRATVVGKGPLRTTLLSPDKATLDAYLSVTQASR